MNMFILLTIFTMLFLNAAYEFTCPSQAHWNIRAKSMCDPPRNYTCLFNVTFRVNVYRERCRRPRLLAPGHKYVFQPDLNKATCSETRYQPFNFDTIGYSDCAYQKSLCNSLGQEAYTRTSTNATVNKKCICNTDGGYGFVRKSQNQYYCNPSTEDCSCYQVINPYNKTGGQKGIKCYEEKTMWRGNHKKDILNVSTITIFEFDNYNYNLNYVPRNEYRIEAVKCVLIASFIYCK
ncbi:uncharacterized protein LOC134697887 [Mytilus trossulus]|uniref:uncharacterized protein LOC134697887 n=1 Tax=Mytilus trossulus TaxID=6551 RepID=UPI0030071015